MLSSSRFRFLHRPSQIISKRMLSQHNYDVVIIGGGMVGCALAAYAGSSKYFQEKSILLIDSVKPNVWESNTPIDHDIRVSAVNPSSIQMMEKIEVWNTVKQLRTPQCVKQLRVWDACSNSSIHFEYPDMNENVAYIVENTALVTAFWRRIQQLKNVETLTDAGGVKRCLLPVSGNSDHLATVELGKGDIVTAKLLIGADGFNSTVRKSMNVHELSWKYQQKGIVGTLKLQDTENENNIAWQRFTPTGPIALLPLNKTTSSLVWTTTLSEADRLLALTPEQFIDELNHSLLSNNDEFPSINRLLSYLPSSPADCFQLPPKIVGLSSEVAAFPLGFQHATNYVTRGVALVGDAAHRVHPLAGQGVNLGFSDVTDLVGELDEAIGRGEELGALGPLRAYESRRQLHNLSVMMTVDSLNRLYATTSPPVVLIRSLGLNLVNYYSPVKEFFIKRASS